MRQLEQRVVVVTGASSGVGRATALAFAEAGATVVVTARRGEVLEEVAEACRQRGVDAVALPVDVRDAAAVDALAREVVRRFHRIDVWVNNAAVNVYGRLEEVPVDLWHGVIETNLLGTYHGTRAALPPMREQGGGVVINVSSVLGKLGSPQQSAYVASKHAVRALSDCTRQEVRDVAGIAVCTVLPGPLDTPLFEHAANYSGRQVKPLKPVIDANRVADAVVSCARRPRREAVVGASSKQVLGFNRLFPSAVERATARQVDHDHFADRPAAPWPGNVAAPIGLGTGISGGWDRTGRQVGDSDRRAVSNGGEPPTGVRALAALGAAGAAVAVALSRRRRS